MEALLAFALILVAFYFLILRPQRARAKQAEQLQAKLAPGAEIMTTSGIFATVLQKPSVRRGCTSANETSAAPCARWTV